MSDMHVLTGDGGGRWTVIMHFPVPDVNNEVGVNYRVALVNSGLGGTTSMVEGTGAGYITSVEKAQIAAGAIYEHVASLLVETGGAGAAQQAMLDAQYNRLHTEVVSVMQNKLKYYGYTQDVA